MAPERWQQVVQLYEAALEREPGARAAFLASAMANDDGLRREVEALLAKEHAAVLIDRPMVAVAGSVLESATMLAPNTLFGPYRIERLVGAGGMGPVYRRTTLAINEPSMWPPSSAPVSGAGPRGARW